MSTPTPDDVRAEVRRLDPNVAEGSDQFRTAVMLLASAIVGPNQAQEWVGEDPDWWRPRYARLVANGVFVEEGVASDWTGEDGGLQFWLDVTIAEGWLERSWVERTG